MQNHQGKLFEHKKEDYTCIEPKTTETCRICYVKRYPKPVTDKCLIGLLQRDPKANKTCVKNEIKQTQDYTTRIGQREWAYSVNKPSSLITVCDKEISEYNIPNQGIVKVPENSICSFKFKNGPFTGFKPYAPGINIQTEIVEYKDESKLQKKMIEIKDHFQEYMYIYIPVILSTIGLLLTILLFLICCFKQASERLPRIPKRKVRIKTQGIKQENTNNRLQMRLNYPFRPGWEIQEI
jgi:hypothetical protein